ncbi:MAG: retropepsin-like domain-containing protein [Verrucomicrobia bacterium]|nr:retropepsin-like domain-containing protein [Verrucomicrobiota bacterium]
MHECIYRQGKASGWMLGFLAGYLLAAAAGSARAEAGNLGAALKQLGYAQIELRRTDENHLFLFGQVNGRRRSCLVDTGWSFTTLSTNAAQGLATRGLVDELKLGRVRLTNETVLVQDLRVNGQPTSFDLVLGCDFLIRHHAVIDYAHRRLYLRREPLTGKPVNQLTAALQQCGLVAVKLSRHDPLALTCTVQINGRAVEFLVDSGAMWSCLTTETAHALALPIFPSANRITGAAVAGKRGFGVTTVRDFELGGRQEARVTLAVLELGDWGLGPNGRTLRAVGGILGGDQLSARAAVIDCGQLKLWQRDRH